MSWKQIEKIYLQKTMHTIALSPTPELFGWEGHTPMLALPPVPWKRRKSIEGRKKNKFDFRYCMRFDSFKVKLRKICDVEKEMYAI